LAGRPYNSTLFYSFLLTGSCVIPKVQKSYGICSFWLLTKGTHYPVWYHMSFVRQRLVSSTCTDFHLVKVFPPEMSWMMHRMLIARDSKHLRRGQEVNRSVLIKRCNHSFGEHQAFLTLPLTV